LVGPSFALWRLGVMRGGIRGRGEVTALAVACTDQIDAQIEIQRGIDGERECDFPKLTKFVKIRKKFVKCPSVGLPWVPGYPSGTRVINYPGNFLLPDGTGTRLVNI